MGNNQSTNNKKQDKTDISSIVSHIATNYIFTSNFKDMQNLSEAEYCNNLVILTSRIIEQNLNDLDIQYLAQHIKDGKVVDLMNKDKVIYLKKSEIPKLDVKNSTQKRRLCIGIAKFYVKIAHIFACIIKTINPTITYTNSGGGLEETDITNKQNLPDNTKMSMNMPSVSLCSKRLDALINNNKYDLDNLNNNTDIYVGPDYCNFNSGESASNLLSEPGMVELEELYNDKYDYDTGKYSGMTSNMKQQYKSDLKLFYEAFSDNKEPFDSNKIKKFSDIKLRDNNKKEGCSKEEGKGEYLIKYKGTNKEQLFLNYARHIKKMMNNTSNNQNLLLSVIDKLFVNINIEDDNYNRDESKNVIKMIIINPQLNERMLQEIVEETRRIVINLYITCESDFLQGLEIFEAIVEQRMKNTVEERLNNLPIHKIKVRDDQMKSEKKERERAEIEKKERERAEIEKKERERADIEKRQRETADIEKKELEKVDSKRAVEKKESDNVDIQQKQNIVDPGKEEMYKGPNKASNFVEDFNKTLISSQDKDDLVYKQ